MSCESRHSCMSICSCAWAYIDAVHTYCTSSINFIKSLWVCPTFYAHSQTNTHIFAHTIPVILYSIQIRSALMPKESDRITDSTDIRIFEIIKLHACCRYHATHTLAQPTEQKLFSNLMNDVDLNGLTCSYGADIICRTSNSMNIKLIAVVMP